MVQIPIIWFLNIWWYALSLLHIFFFIFLHFPPSHTKILLYSFFFILSHCAINISIYLNSLYEPHRDCYDQENRAERKKKTFIKLKWRKKSCEAEMAIKMKIKKSNDILLIFKCTFSVLLSCLYLFACFNLLPISFHFFHPFHKMMMITESWCCVSLSMCRLYSNT